VCLSGDFVRGLKERGPGKVGHSRSTQLGQLPLEDLLFKKMLGKLERIMSFCWLTASLEALDYRARKCQVLDTPEPVVAR